MMHQMKLQQSPFTKIKNGSKTIELRLNDEKRRQVKVGDIDNDDPMAVFGYPDAYKIRSCMTLFKHTAPEQELFQLVLDKFCRGIEDDNTLETLGK